FAEQQDFVVMKLSGATGVPAWRRDLQGGAGMSDEADAVVLDGSGNAYVAGYMSGGIGVGLTVVKLSAPNGTVLWTHSTGTGSAVGIVLDPQGYAVAAGSGHAASGDMTVVKLAAATGASVTCGNGIVESGENCDDGNLTSADCCSPTCTHEGV